MSLTFFLDQCVPVSVGRHLSEADHTVLRLIDYMPTNSPDPNVIAKAQELDAILVSLNGDFADIVAYPPARYGGIIALQIHNHPEVLPRLLIRLTDYLHTHKDRETYRGKLLIAEPHRIRIRH